MPSRYLFPNRFALVDGDNVFDTNAPSGKGPMRSYTTVDTAGCSCEQIIDELGVGLGHNMFGCSISVMDDWLAYLDERSCGNCVTNNDGPGCEVSACEATVCDVDPFCCNVTWDSLCADQAIDMCSPDLCLALPAPVRNSVFRSGRIVRPMAEPVSKDPNYVPPPPKVE